MQHMKITAPFYILDENSGCNSVKRSTLDGVLDDIVYGKQVERGGVNAGERNGVKNRSSNRRSIDVDIFCPAVPRSERELM